MPPRKKRVGGRGRAGEAIAAAQAVKEPSSSSSASSSSSLSSSLSSVPPTSTISVESKPRCKLFARGKCTKGSRCKFLHVKIEKDSEKSNVEVDFESDHKHSDSIAQLSAVDDGERHAARQRRKRNALSSGKKSGDDLPLDAIFAVIDEVNGEIDSQATAQRERVKAKQEWVSGRVRAKEDKRLEQQKRKDALIAQLKQQRQQQKTTERPAKRTRTEGKPAAAATATSITADSASPRAAKSVRFA